MKCVIVSPIPFRACLLLLGAALLASSVAPTTAQPVRPGALIAQTSELGRDRPEAGGTQRQLAPLVEEREELLLQLDELRRQGRDDGAAEIKERILSIERELARRQRRAERPPRTNRESAPGHLNAGEIERRAHHLEVAIENLHAAGLHEPAERLTGQLERMRQHLAEVATDGPHRPEVPGEVIEELRAQIGDLHRIVRQLRAEVEELRRERD